MSLFCVLSEIELPLWLASVFPWKISSTYFDEIAQNTRQRCLIDSPSITMSHPVIDFDTNRSCNIILKSAKEPPSSRWKPVLAVVRGMGSGKTRCFEEIRRELLRRPGVLPLGITFNSGQNIDGSEYLWGNNHQTAFAFMIIARCCSVLFDKDFDDMRNLITRELPRLNTGGMKKIGRDTIDEFLRFVVAKVRSQGRDVNDVVVIIDEVVKAEDGLNERYGNKAEACSVLREAILDEKTKPFNFNATLCISSLRLKPLGYPTSDRPVETLRLPSMLSPQRIVTEWWKCRDEDKRVLLYVAACVNTLPRAVEIVGKYLNKHSDQPIDQNFIKDLFVDFKMMLRFRYQFGNFPHANLIYSIVFSKYIPLDDTAQSYIAQSILLNSIETCLPKVVNILPESSLAVLAAIGDDNKVKEGIEKDTEDIYQDVLQEVVRLAGKNVREGIPFEHFVTMWMKYRWLVAFTANKEIKFGELLGISEEKINRINFKTIRNALSLIATTRPPTERDFEYLKINSNYDEAGHIREVKALFVDADNRMAFRKGAEGDKFDFVAALYQGEEVDPFFIYGEKKSPAPGNTQSKDVFDDRTVTLHQYENVKRMCQAAGVSFLFCYVTHYPGTLSEREKDCLILRANEMKAFFGPMWPLFITCRSTFSD